MIAYVNPRAGAGRGMARWSSIESRMSRTYRDLHIVMADAPDSAERAVRRAQQSPGRRIVAVGGDGTVNALVNALLNGDHNGGPPCTLGAIGTGSSNDFHKPFTAEATIGAFPARLDFDRASAYDAGRVEWTNAEVPSARYFFLNASAGITAAGNARFNVPGPLLGLLKRAHVPSAILFTALTTLLGFRNVHIRLTLGTEHLLDVPLTNLGILKSPHFSGDLRYDTAGDYENGKFVVVACTGMNTLERITLFRALRRGSLAGVQHVRRWSTSAVTLESPCPIGIEFDGETVLAQSARFTVVPHALQVCP